MRKIFGAVAATVFLSLSFQSIASATDMPTVGPGGKIAGIDISRWQHPNEKAIDFVKMHTAGISFVMIKGSDTRDDADLQAVKYLKGDRAAAQAAGIYTGFYHFATLPNVTTPAAIARDARVQALKVTWRIASLGGFNAMDLPIALDLENNCVRLSSAKLCTKRASRKAATLWAKTFLKSIKDKTGRTPFIYSSPHFLETSMVRDSELASYPLWIAQYAIDPAKDGAKPNVKKGGCFVHSWTTSQCSANWTLWQYTSCGIAPKYGVPGTRVDLNIFGGAPEKFQSLLTGTWIPDPADQMPQGEPSTIGLTSVKATSTDKNVIITVDVKRPDGSPVVTGSVKYYFDATNPLTPKVTQSVARETSGTWTLTIAGLPAGTWSGSVGFKDESGTHADVATPLVITVEQGPTPLPTPVKKPVTHPAVDSCKNQIRN
ncbi:MAG: glycoside hydrolase family 25 protein [Actinomycetota bacterium]